MNRKKNLISMDHLRTFLIILASFLFLPAEAANGKDAKDIKYNLLAELI